MYREHQPIISTWARANPDNLARVIQFCILSARVKFYNVPADIEIAARGGVDSLGVLFGWKTRAYAEAWERRAEIHWNCEDIWEGPGARRERANALLGYLAHCYGLNVAKAGFVCQLAYGVSGCLDSVNIGRLGLSPRLCANYGQAKTPKRRRRMAGVYNGVVYRLGGPARLWDDWCAAIAERYPNKFPTAESASAWHLTCLQIGG